MVGRLCALLALLSIVGCGAAAPGLPSRSDVVSNAPSLGSDNTKNFGDVATLARVGNFTAIAWDPFDRLLIGLPWSGYPAIALGSNRHYKLPSSATGIAFDTSTKTFYFASGQFVYASKPDATLVTVTSVLGNAGTMTIDPSGALYVIDGDHIDRIVRGKVSVFALPGTVTAYPGDGPPGPPSLAFDAADGHLYLTDTYTDTVKRIVLNGRAEVVAGHCGTVFNGYTPCYPGNIPGKGSGVWFGGLSGIAYDPTHKTLIVADAKNNQLWRVTPGGDASPVAGYGPSASFDGNGWHAFFEQPLALTYAASEGAVIFADISRVGTYAVRGPRPPPETEPTARYPLASPDDFPGSPAIADGGAWFESGNELSSISSSGKIRNYKTDVGLGGNIAVDRHGNVFTNYYVVLRNVAGILERYAGGHTQRYIVSNADAGEVNALSIGPDGNVWFSVSDFTNPAIGTIANGRVVLYSLGGGGFGGPRPGAIISGPDGTIWYALANSNEIGRITTTGRILTPLKIGVSVGLKMVLDRKSGSVWFNDGTGSDHLYRLDRNGKVTSFVLPCDACYASDLAIDSHGTLWVAGQNPSAVVGVDTGGKMRAYYMPFANPGGDGIGVASDQSIWVMGAGQIFNFNPAAYARARLPLFQQ